MNTNTQKKIALRDSVRYQPKGLGQGWFQRTFSKIEDGSLKGNIFMLIMTTMGSAFLMIPYYAKQNGIILMVIVTIFPALISYIGSIFLYWGFKATEAKTYDECMQFILGKSIGYFSNLIIFFDTFGGAIACWLFSYQIFFSFVSDVVTLEQDQIQNFNGQCEKIYFLIIFILLFLFQIWGNVNILNQLSLVGFMVMIYIIMLSIVQMPAFYNHYNSIDPIQVVPIIWSKKIFEAFGFSSFIFVNQYSILPICNNLNRVCSKRIQKVIQRTISFIVLYNLVFMFFAYFSLPNNMEDVPMIFLTRQSLPGQNDYFMLVGKFLFWLNLVLTLFVKVHFLILYFHQMIHNSKLFFTKQDDENQQAIDKPDDKQQELHVIEEEPERDTDVSQESQKQSMDLGLGLPTSYISDLENQTKDSIKENIDQEEPIDTDEEQEIMDEEAERKLQEKINKQKKLGKIKISQFQRNSRVITLSPLLETDQQIVEEQEKNQRSHMFLNFFFLLLTTLMTFALKNNLNQILSFMGGVIGNFEIVIFPFMMIFIIDSYHPILNFVQKFGLIFFGTIFVIAGFTSSYLALFNQNKN